MNQLMMRTAVYLMCGGLALAAVGCGNNQETAQVPTTQPVRSPGAAPTFGKPSGMGFSTGNAADSDGQGSGLMGFHGTGAAGTSAAITDTHKAVPSEVPTTEPVLPPA